MNPRPQRSIGEHGVIGNLSTAALVALDGAIDFLCWPHFDSPTIFASLLDPEQGGVFELAPMAPDAHAEQAYHPGTNILVTRWYTATGIAELTDFLPLAETDNHAAPVVMRRVHVIDGTVRFRLHCRPRFDYARTRPVCRPSGRGVVFEDHAGLALRLSGSVKIVHGDAEASAEWALGEGKSASFVLHNAADPLLGDAEIARSLKVNIERWRAWTGRGTLPQRWRAELMRSALVLKLLTSHDHGAIAAAVTFGLPEQPGGGRNWDYRACWIRDGAWSAAALLRLGHTEEAAAFLAWVRRMHRRHDGSLPVMAALDGQQVGEERALDHLAGYANSRPVRIGNGARDQFQLDITGEWLDCIATADARGVTLQAEDWPEIVTQIGHVCAHWQEADCGIWEPRSGNRAHLHSRLMCWVALDRAIALAQDHALPLPVGLWRRTRTLIHTDIWHNFRHPTEGYFVQAMGGTDLDAALLMLPLMGFVADGDPVWLATLDAIGSALVRDGRVYRYRTADGLEGDEGSFAPCTFWYAECLARAGRWQAAEAVMQAGLHLANPLGLFAEEAAEDGRPLGNFPQAMTHLAFINAALFLATGPQG